MSLGFSCSQQASHKQTQTQTLRIDCLLSESFGETSGEIPVYSMYRIRSQLKKAPIALQKFCLQLLWNELVKANAAYQQATGNKWNCLTSNNLIAALEKFDDVLSDMIYKRKRLVEEENLLIEAKNIAGKIIKDWFENNFTNLLYDMNKSIPWPILCRLRQGLHDYIIKSYNPFSISLEAMIVDVAKEKGYENDGSVEDLWKKMGGKIFTKKADDLDD